VNDQPVILFDGVCNFCNGAVNFVLDQDRKEIFRFASLQSEAGRKLLEEHCLPTDSLGSFILIDKGKAYTRSTAALRVLNRLPWFWKGLQLFWIVPPFLRNAVYNLIARNRYKWFGKREQCRVPTPDIRSRFLG
jgi:predicted DCC family thiol-disulfide oxidoreductase YuxK